LADERNDETITGLIHLDDNSGRCYAVNADPLELRSITHLSIQHHQLMPEGNEQDLRPVENRHSVSARILTTAWR